MALILQIPDLDDVDSPYASMNDYRYGFPLESLVALYLLQDGTVGQAYSGSIRDASGKGNDGTLLANSAVPVQQSYGLAFGGAGGFRTPIPAAAPYTVVEVVRQRIATSGSVYAVPGYHAPTGTLDGASNYGPGGAGLVITQDIQFASDVGKLNVGLFAAGSQPFPGSQSRRQAGPITLASEQSFMSLGYAVDRNTDRLDFRTTGGATFQTNVTAVNNVARNQAGFHAFGMFKNGAAPVGDVCLAAVFNRALSAPELDAVLATAKTLVSARGFPVV